MMLCSDHLLSCIHRSKTPVPSRHPVQILALSPVVVTFVVPPWVVVRQSSGVYVQEKRVNGSKARVLDHCNQCCILVLRYLLT